MRPAWAIALSVAVTAAVRVAAIGYRSADVIAELRASTRRSLRLTSKRGARQQHRFRYETSRRTDRFASRLWRRARGWTMRWRSVGSRRTRTRALLALNLLSFIALSSVAFRMNVKQLFLGLDGGNVLDLARAQAIWQPSSLALSSNPLQSLGNAWFPLNTAVLAGYVPIRIAGHSTGALAAAYTVFALELFASTFLLARALSLSRVVATIAAWMLPLLTMPYLSASPVYPVMGLVPSTGTAIALHSVIVSCLLAIGSTSAFRSALAWCAMALAVTVCVVGLPATTVLLLPPLVVYGCAIAAGAASRREALIKAAAPLLLVIAATAVGGTSFVRGLIENTAARVFPTELKSMMPWYEVSIVQHGPVFGWAGPILFGAGLCGAGVLWRRAQRRRRVFLLGHLAAMAGILSVGLIFVGRGQGWEGPNPLYFEFLLWPCYAIFSAVAATFVLRRAMPLQRSIGPAVLLACGILPWAVLATSPTERPLTWNYPPTATEITRTLEHEVAIAPGQVFRGRVATFAPSRIGTVWMDQHNFDGLLVERLGNDHRVLGLWYFGVPTLIEYNPLLTPGFYLVATRFFATVLDRQTRNIVTLTRPSVPHLEALGVKFVIATEPRLPGATARHSITSGDVTLWLHELPDPNVGDFAPVSFTMMNAADAAMKRMLDASFDFRHDVLVNRPLPVSLVSPSGAHVVMRQGALQVHARSAGQSLLVLPFEFSHCGTVHATASGVELFRANLAMTGVLFSGDLDAEIRYQTGPFDGSDCRLRDLEDARRLGFGRVPPAAAESVRPRVVDK